MIPFKFPAEQTPSEQLSQQDAFNKGYQTALAEAQQAQEALKQTLKQDYQHKISLERERVVEELRQQQQNVFSELQAAWEKQNAALDRQLQEEIFLLIEQVVGYLYSDDIAPEISRIKQSITEAVNEIQQHQTIEKIELPISYQAWVSDINVDHPSIEWCFSDQLASGQVVFYTAQQQHRLDVQKRIDVLLDHIKAIFTQN